MPNRLAIVDEDGLAYDRTGLDIQITFQDDGKTIKIFVRPSENAAEEKAAHRSAFAHDLEECKWPH